MANLVIVGAGTTGVEVAGELRYSLLHAYGTAFDNPSLLLACVVGDGEAETGALAASWHSNKFLNPATDAAVLPILHLNGYKLSGPAILARLSQQELRSFFEGCGDQYREIVGDEPATVHRKLWAALNWAYAEIRSIQQQARAGKKLGVPRWPVIVLRTPKGWTGPKTLDGKPVEGAFHSHQIPIEDPAENPGHLKALEAWLRSYRPVELFDSGGKPVQLVTAIYPAKEKCMRRNRHANGGELLKPLQMPDFTGYGTEIHSPGETQAKGTEILGRFLRDVFRENQAQCNFRLFCPDETISNRLQAVFEATLRAFELPMVATDEFLSPDRRVMEVLSEHCCEGWLEGYLLTGRDGIFACYEAFISIVDSMMAQYAKWQKMARDIPWRKPVASLNYLHTSHISEQDHNGYSHQGPTFINMLLTRKSSMTRMYFPPDANCLLAVADHCLRSHGYINPIVASKKPMLQWLVMKKTQEHCARRASVWEWASNDAGGAPDVVLASAGDVPTRETLAAAWLLQSELPGLRVRVVNIVDLFTLASHRDHPHGLDEAAFNALFTESADVVFAFHGYPQVIHELIYRRPSPERFHVRGYIEEGTTTTPFDMTVVNHLSRYDLAMEALRRTSRFRSQAGDVIESFSKKLVEHRAYIEAHDRDMPEVLDWRWTR